MGHRLTDSTLDHVHSGAQYGKTLKKGLHFIFEVFALYITIISSEITHIGIQDHGKNTSFLIFRLKMVKNYEKWPKMAQKTIFDEKFS